MGGEAEPQPFALLQGVFALAFSLLIGDVEPLLTRCLGQLLCCPTGIACSCEIENHGAKVQKKYQNPAIIAVFSFPIPHKST